MRHGDLHRREMEKRDFEQGVPHDDREGGAGESRHCDSEGLRWRSWTAGRSGVEPPT